MATTVLKKLGIYQMIEEISEIDVIYTKPITIPILACMEVLTEKSTRPKIEGFVEDVVQRLSPSEFRRHFRVSLDVYTHLLNDLRADLTKIYRGGFEPVPPEKQILIFLWYSANQDSQREIGILFNVCEWYVNTSVKNVAEVMCTRVNQYIKMPNIDREDEISSSFEGLCGISNIVGALDGTHIPIVNCPGGKNDYINRKGYPSVQLQLIVDDTLLINDAYVGWPGSTHDARVLRNSGIYNNAEEGNAISAGKFLIGDGAYPLRRWLITPYRDNGHLNRQKKKYNKAVSSARQCVERANAHLKGRFRRLQKVYCCEVKDICNLVMSCCILHNLCIICDDDIEDFIDMNQTVNVNQYPNIFGNYPRAETMRDTIAGAL